MKLRRKKKRVKIERKIDYVIKINVMTKQNFKVNFIAASFGNNINATSSLKVLTH